MDDLTRRVKEELVSSKASCRRDVGSAVASLRIESARQVEDARTLIKDLARTLSETAPVENDATERLKLVEAERDDLLTKLNDDDERLQHAVSLYETITGIKWHTPDSGVIAYDHLQTAKRFSLPRSLPSVDKADAIWRLIDDPS